MQSLSQWGVYSVYIEYGSRKTIGGGSQTGG